MPPTGDKIGQSNEVNPTGNHAFQPLAADGTRIQALAIDDEEELLNLIKELLEPYGVDVHPFTDPVKALDMFSHEREKFHLVLLDYSMPKLDGAKTFVWLKKLNPDVKVIIVSAFEALRLRQILAQHPVDDYIHKPFRIEEAVQVIRHVMSKPEAKTVAH
jgi:DNA-binding response OmpR family regulator